MNDALWSETRTATTTVDRRETRAIRRAAIALGTVLVLALLAIQLGVIRPGIVHDGSGGAEGAAGTASVSIDITNRGIVTETLSGVSLDYPGLSITSARLEPARVGAFEDGRLVLDVTVDCSAPAHVDGVADEQGQTAFDDMVVLEADAPMVIRTERPWGTVTRSDSAMGSTVVGMAAIACYEIPTD